MINSSIFELTRQEKLKKRLEKEKKAAAAYSSQYVKTASKAQVPSGE